ncbi:MAG TPA: ribosome maturation factor RimP [Actinotalea sp.]|nr:ribosome maturation factor RimP [Actinotalea sp.]
MGGDTVTPANNSPALRVREVVQPVVDAAGLVLEDVVVTAAGRRSVVRIVLDLDDDAIGGLDLDTVGVVSRDISAAMDAADPVRGAYVLEVSTPGTDRPLTSVRHFRRARTRMVRLDLRDGSGRLGRLVAADADGLELEVAPGATEHVALADVVRGHVEVELSHAHDDALPDDWPHDAGPHDDEPHDDEEGPA